MSQNLQLIKYEEVDGALSEEHSSTIISTSISSELLEELMQVSPLIEIDIIEGKNPTDSFKVDCINNEKLSQIYSRCDEIFMRKLQDSAEQYIKNGQLILSSEGIAKLVYEFRELTNVMHLIKIKMEKYYEDLSALIQVG